MKVKKTPKPDTQKEDLAAELESRFSVLSEAVGELEVLAQRLPQEIEARITEKVNAAVESFNELRERHMERVEDKIVLRVLDFFNQCPFWETLKVDHNDHSTADAHMTITAILKKGWRYVGHYHNPKPPYNRYDLFVRPQGRALTEQEYLKQYNEFERRREAASKQPSKPEKTEKKVLKAKKNK